MALRILVIESDPDLQVMLEASLGVHDYEVSVAADGQQGLDHAKRESPDLILLDALIPRLSAFEFTQQIRSAQSDLKDTPIFVMLQRKQMRDIFLATDIDAFISKPVVPGTLLRRIQQVLENQAARKQTPLKPTQTSLKRPVLIAGVQNFLIQKMQEHLSGQGFTPVICLTEKDMIQKAIDWDPPAIFCQYWEDPDFFDAAFIYQSMRERVPAIAKKVGIYCLSALVLDAIKEIPKDQVLPFDESPDLLKKIDFFLQSQSRTS